MRLEMIAAMSENNVIGCNGKMPWHIPEDLQYFKKTTLGCPVIMGRKTFESLGRPLPKRHNIVISRTVKTIEGCTVVANYAAAIAAAANVDRAFIIGGESIFRDFLDQVAAIHLTIIHKTYTGDTHFPTIDATQFDLKQTTDLPDASTPISIRLYERKQP